MSHSLYIAANNKASFAYKGPAAWHILGNQVPANANAFEMQEAAGANWEAQKIACMYRNPAWNFGSKGAQYLPTGTFCVVRSDTGDMLAESVSAGWQAPNNREMFETFDYICRETGASMETVGVIKKNVGQVVFGLAKLNADWAINNDVTKTYLFFSASHKFGLSVRIDFTNIRVVCDNTLTAAINISDREKTGLTFTHRTKVDHSKIKALVGLSEEHAAISKARAEALYNVKPSDDDVREFFAKVFPLTSKANVRNKELSRNAEFALALNADSNVPGQPEAGESWWRAFNTVTYMTDHHLARDTDNRMFSAMLAGARANKIKALNMALEYAGADSSLATPEESAAALA